MKELVRKFIETNTLTEDEARQLILDLSEPDVCDALKEEAVRLREKYYGKKVFTRGLIEFSNYCRNNCYYCGIGSGNRELSRYRLSPEEILACCGQGYRLGYRTFVLQSGEDPYYTKEILAGIIRSVKKEYPECAVTLSVGERTEEEYEAWKEAGADRYLLRHETASRSLYEKIHPESMSFDNRIRCLYTLKELGYQVGAGFMVGIPGQTVDDLAKDLVFLKELSPEMAGIGPFIPHHATRFKDEPEGSVDLTIRLLSVIRILLPKVLLPATTALGTADPLGREKGLLAGANVVMPNLSPTENRAQYELYDHKICVGDDADACRDCLAGRVRFAGYELVSERGDHVDVI